MTAAALFNSLTDRKFTLRVDGESLYVEPTSRLEDEDKSAIRAAKADLMRYLTSPMPQPSLRPDGSILIPLSTHPIYQHWAGGQSIWDTLEELGAGVESYRKYGYRDGSKVDVSSPASASATSEGKVNK